MGTWDHSKCAFKVRVIERFHEVTRGWADIAYNFVVCPHGYVFEGRGVGVKSAANGWEQVNDDWYAVCYLGGQGDPFTAEAKTGFVRARQLLVEHGAGRLVNGHRDHHSTECPGDEIYRWLNSVDWTQPPPNEEDDMPTAEEIAKAVWDQALNEYDSKSERDTAPARILLAQAHNRVTQLVRRDLVNVDDLATKVAARISTTSGAVDAGTVKQAVKDALAEGIDG